MRYIGEKWGNKWLKFFGKFWMEGLKFCEGMAELDSGRNFGIIDDILRVNFFSSQK